MNLGVDSLSISSSSASWRSGDLDLDSDRFPEGLRVLVVDDDQTCLMIMEKMLQNCLYHYQVTKCNRAEDALKLLRENKHGFDIVISDVYMPDMDGFKLLEHIGLEMDLPVIMMSADDSRHVMMKGIKHGACDYLTKPVCIEALQNIWQHVVRRKKKELKDLDFEPSGSTEDGEQLQKASEDVTSLANGGDCKSSKKRKDEEDECSEERDNTASTTKKPRVVWSCDLHQQFVNAVNQIGADRAVPKKILELMNVPWLTRENIASHLQKYRVYLKKLSEECPHGLRSSFMGPQDTSFGITTSCNGLVLQPLMSSSRIPPQHIPTVQAAALGWTANKSPLSMPLMDQRNSFGFGSPAAPGRTAALQQSVPAFGHMNANTYLYSQLNQRSPLLPHMVRPQSSTQMLNLQSSVTRPVLPRASSSVVLGQDYTPVSQPSTSMYQCAELGGNTFPLASSSRIAAPAITRTPQEYLTPEMKREFISTYDTFNEIFKNSTDDWGLPIIEPNIVQTGFSDQSEQHTDTPSDKGLGSSTNNDLGTSCPIDNSWGIKSETLNGIDFDDSLFSDQFGQEDLLDSFLNQHQEGTTQLENVLNIDVSKSSLP